jgi:hypothetical protein
MRAKFRVGTIKEHFRDDEAKTKYAEEVWFSAVYSSDPEHENYTWAKLTPAGNAYLRIENPSAFGHYKEGQEISLDFNTSVQ